MLVETDAIYYRDYEKYLELMSCIEHAKAQETKVKEDKPKKKEINKMEVVRAIRLTKDEEELLRKARNIIDDLYHTIDDEKLWAVRDFGIEPSTEDILTDIFDTLRELYE